MKLSDNHRHSCNPHLAFAQSIESLVTNLIMNTRPRTNSQLEALPPKGQPFGSRILVDLKTRSQQILEWIALLYFDFVKVENAVKRPANQYKSFIEENILDKNVGPEISRSLRR